jgi:CelD/BcsL family acetyltransferase involved in cellulose biosynthesis
MLKCDVIPPSRLGTTELTAWLQMLEATPHLQRAFFTPTFARACEAAGFRVRVGVLHEGGRLRGFLPFQFNSPWHAGIGLAERVGGEMSDNAGLIAEPDFVSDPVALLRSCGVNRLFVTHLAEGQEVFGLTAKERRIGHRIDLAKGSAAYFAMLASERRDFVQDTERRLRRAEREYGEVRFIDKLRPKPATVMELIARKRAQYLRSGAADIFTDPRRLRLIDELLAADAPDCRPLFTTMFAGRRWLAGHFGLIHRDVLSYWFPVYDPAAKQVSPGRLLLWRTLQSADALGLRMIDRGEGDNQAKRDFSTGTSRFGRVDWSSGAVRARVGGLCQAIGWRLAARRKAQVGGREGVSASV